jgi:hypothetical protein
MEDDLRRQTWVLRW